MSEGDVTANGHIGDFPTPLAGPHSSFEGATKVRALIVFKAAVVCIVWQRRPPSDANAALINYVELQRTSLVGKRLQTSAFFEFIPSFFK
jgi:hypothetical protein